MSAPELKEALRLVETLGLAPLNRVDNARPNKNFGDPAIFDRWSRRLREVEADVAARLADHGARVVQRDGATIRFAGMTACSTMGLHQALKNWQAKAAARLAVLGGRR